MSSRLRIKNSKAKFEFEFLESFTAGMRLTGTEIKSIRAGKANITEAFCVEQNNEIFIRNMSIEPYANAGFITHEVRGDRKLLLNRIEIDKISKKLRTKGLALVPYVVFINDKGLAKVDIKLAKGKNNYDKREDLKSKDAKRDMDRLKKIYR
ncbi:MAG: SsrA-binding protein [Flavobacteriales bacterium]|jgi:SsrA-binding protein